MCFRNIIEEEIRKGGAIRIPELCTFSRGYVKETIRKVPDTNNPGTSKDITVPAHYKMHIKVSKKMSHL